MSSGNIQLTDKCPFAHARAKSPNARSPPAAFVRKAALLARYQTKTAIAQIPKKVVLLEVAIPCLSGLRINVAVGDKKFFPAVVVEIGEAGSPCQVLITGRVPKLGLVGYIFELPVVVVIKGVVILGKVGNKQIEPAVIIVVTNELCPCLTALAHLR